MGDHVYNARTCKECEAHRYECEWCHAECIGDEGEDLCEKCFRSYVPLHDVEAVIKASSLSDDAKAPILHQLSFMRRRPPANMGGANE